MNAKKMWTLDDWNEYAISEGSIDISSEVSETGHVPVECPNRKCKAKLFDVESRTTKKGPLKLRGVYCTLCGWEGLRFMGARRG